MRVFEFLLPNFALIINIFLTYKKKKRGYSALFVHFKYFSSSIPTILDPFCLLQRLHIGMRLLISSVPPLYLGMRWSMVVFSSGSGLPHLAQTPQVFSRIIRFMVCFFCLSVLKVPPHNVSNIKASIIKKPSK